MLHFEKFDVESADGDCPFDKVVVLDGSESTAPTLAELCGNELPADILARGSSLLVVFSADSSRTGPGFWATYTTNPRGGSSNNDIDLYDGRAMTVECYTCD